MVRSSGTAGTGPSVLARVIRTPWLVRLPIPVFRAGFGFLFAGRILLLEHRGRVSGQWHTTALEVASRESKSSILVASGFGTSAQWYRNLEADERCVVSVGFIRRRRARAELLGADASAAALEEYARRHPVAWRELQPMVAELTGDPAARVPLVRLRLE